MACPQARQRWTRRRPSRQASQNGADSASTTGSGFGSATGQHAGRVGREDAARAIHEGDFGPGHLAVARLAAKLTDRFHDEEEAEEAGMAVRQTAAAGVEREGAAWRDPATLHERASLAPPAETERLQGKEHGD